MSTTYFIKATLGFMLLLLCLTAHTFATHIRAGYLTASKKDNSTNLTYLVSVTLYRDVTGIPAGEGLISFGDGSDPTYVMPQSLGFIDSRHTEVLKYEVEHTFTNEGSFGISYFERNRNNFIKNMDKSGNVPFYIESTFEINHLIETNSSPILLVPPTIKARINQTYRYNPGAFDTDGDSLSYRLTVCKQGKDLPVQNYRFLNDASENWIGKQEDCTSEGQFYIDPIIGDLVWDTPNEVGEYNVAFFVDEWREGVKIGSVNMDMQIIVTDHLNIRPEITIPNDTCIVAGQILEGLIVGKDNNQDCSSTFTPSLDAVDVSLVANPIVGGATMEVQQTTVYHQQNAIFNAQINIENIRSQPYQFSFQVLDYPYLNNFEQNWQLQLGSTKSWRVKVLAPAPEALTAKTDQVTGSVQLDWNAYDLTNADKIHIYRRKGAVQFDHQCKGGIPESSGYEKIAEVNANQATYTDLTTYKSAEYSYRIYATFKKPKGGISVASEPASAFVPPHTIIQQVSTLEPASENGKVQVTWTKTNDGSLAKPITYTLYRGEGLNGKQNPTAIASNLQENDTLFVDQSNTEEQLSHYWVEVYANGTLALTTPTASQVNLKSVPAQDGIELLWEMDVPWSITDTTLTHYIYRQQQGVDNGFVLMDSVKGSISNHYFDNGSALNQPLAEGQVYNYYLSIQGNYNQQPIMLPNHSLVIADTILEAVPPCPPVIESTRDGDIISFIANTEIAQGCDDEVVAYRLYYSPIANAVAQDYTLAGEYNSTSFSYSNNIKGYINFAVTAVDASGNESPFSNTIIVDYVTGGLDELDFLQPLLYPNPSKGSVTLQVSLSKGTQLSWQVISSQAKVVQTNSQFFVSGTHRIPVSRKQLPVGIYLIKIWTAEGAHFIKWIAE
ncbi:T9SS type A sorting domain-containing protein [Limibacter armeniacum]|uniref:T9SS type A sorting domain-containing protein n=1 Tax=Limibacter armeniacum TaxID=466084 RepID=UPI002FE6A8FE